MVRARQIHGQRQIARAFVTLVLALGLAGLGLAGCGDDDNPQPDTHVVPDAGPDTTTSVDQRVDAVVHKALTMKVVHLNDTHSQIEANSQQMSFTYNSVKEKTTVSAGGYPRLITKIKALKSGTTPAVVVHAGDALQGSLYYVKYEGEADAEFLNLMQLDAMGLGNHEFDKGPAKLATFIGKVTFPILGGNVDATQETSLTNKFKPYVIKTVGGESVAIMSLITTDTPSISSPGTKLVFKDHITTAKALVKEIEGKGVNKIILLSHLSSSAVAMDEALAKAVDGIDVIVSGHSHELIGDYSAYGLTKKYDYPQKVKSPAGKDVCIVQAWEKGKVMGVLDVSLDKDGFVTSCTGNPLMAISDTFKQTNTSGQLVEVDAARKTAFTALVAASKVMEIVTEDATALTKLTTYKAGVDQLKTQVVATVQDNLWHVRIPYTTHTTSGDTMTRGSYIAPHVAEALAQKAKSLGQNVDFALINAGAPRTDIAAGNLTMGDIYTLMPFGNTLFVLKLTGKQLKDQLDAAVSKAIATTSPSTGAFPYVSAALRYTADVTKAAGSRITVLEHKDSTGTWKAVQDTTTYFLATVSFLAGGGDSYTILQSATTFRLETGFLDAEAFTDYAKAVTPLKRFATDTGVTYIK